ncbi:MAG TPA: riboflavin synthase [Longimicrobium sp.]
MFTGIVEEVGTVEAVREEGNGVVFTLAARAVRDGLGLGDSVAVDGACLTVTSLFDHAFTVQAVGTTLGRTTFGTFAPGRRVNLERALSLGQRLGGHIVQGHVDGLGEVVAITPQDELVLIDFRMPDDVAAVTVLHGSITLNGISLTVNALPAPGVCQVSIIPFTWEHTNLVDLQVGDAVNLEGDTIGKYVRHLLGMPAAQAAGGAPQPEHVLRAWGYEGTPGG